MIVCRLFVSVAIMLLLLGLPVLADSLVIDDFRSVDGWMSNQDGGLIEISQDALHRRGDNPSMRLQFRGGKYGWGNAARSVALPPNACGVEFDLFVNDVSFGAALSLWLFEADGDGYHSWVSPGNEPLYKTGREWRHCYVPITSFRYDPRGNKTKEMLATNKMLIGVNNVPADISIANLAFRIVRRESKMPESRTQDMQIQDGPKGRVAILADRFEPRPGNADPQLLASTLQRRGYGVTLLKSGDMADTSILKPDNFDCLILPYGPSYPLAAYDSIKSYLKSGGSLLSMGGYAFDEPCAPDESGRLVPVDMAVTAEDLATGGPSLRNLNTRFGRSEDTMGLDPDQVGVFDPSYHLKYVAGLRAAPMQHIVPGSFKVKMAAQGYAACSILGSNCPVFPEKWGRHIPLIDAFDSFRRLRGPTGAIAFNYAGPYAKSSWAFFGVTNVDLFSKDGPMLPHLGAIVDALVAKTFLHSLETDLSCYKNGETVKLSCKVADLGKKACSASVVFRVFERGGKQVFASQPLPVTLRAGDTATVGAEFRPTRFSSDLYRVAAEMSVGGKMVDAVEIGFVAYDPKVTAGGFRLEFKDNYFRDGSRPVLLSGTNVTGEIFVTDTENPLIWDRDLARMNENGLNIVRVLHFSPFVSDTPSTKVGPLDLNLEKLPLKLERQFDALVQLCQKHKIVLFLDIHDWMGIALTDKELEAQRRFAELIASRYKNAPGFMIDIQNEPYIELPKGGKKGESPQVVKEWNNFLRLKYGTDDALKAAWKASPPESELGDIPYRAGTDGWDDMRTFDADLFRTVLANRWIAANYEGAKKGDPNVPVTVGFLHEYWPLNKLMCMDGLDFANMHSYTPIDVLRADLKLFDRRFEGKSISLGEFGALPDHDKRIRGEDNANEDYSRFLITGHYLFGEGGSFLANWCWKDMDAVVFPWGINYTCGGPRKDILKAYRNQSLLMRQVKPLYKPQEVFLVAPVNQMLGGQSDTTVRMLYRFVEVLLSARVDFGVIDDRHLSQLPSSAKLLLYPIPFSVPDDTYGQIESFVARGGMLCITGDISYDDLRRRSRTNRLEELCGVRFVSENYANVGWGEKAEACINVEPTSATKIGGLYVNKLGEGEVYYTPNPTGKLNGSSGFIFTAPLKKLGDSAVVGASAGHAFRIHETDGGRMVLLVNPDSEPQTVRISEPGAETVELSLAGNGAGMVRFDKSGKPLAVESQGSVKIGAAVTIPAKGHFALISCDGKEIPSSRELIILPFGEGEIDLSVLKRVGELAVQTGDVENGKWLTLSKSECRKVRVSKETAFDIRIVAPRNRLADLARFVTSELTLR